MAISVVGNFDININSPIDSRLVATNSSALNSIAFKYPGLKVYLLEDGKTYVYGTNSQWTIDGGQGGGIYGGSGSLPDNVGVYMGTVGSSANDTSKKLYHFAETELTSQDRGYLYSYFYRNNDGDYSDTISYTTEYKFYEDNQGVSITQGPFIEYNGLDDSYEDAVGNLILGTPKLSGVDKGKKIIISSSDYIAFNPSGDENVFPLTIAYDSGLYFGWNYNPNLLPSKSYLFDEYSSSRIKFDDSTIFESRKIETDTWNQVLSIDNNVLPNEVDSPIELVVDTSSKYWDSTVTTRTTELKTVPGIVRDLEHKFNKLQMWNEGTIRGMRSNVLLLQPNGNSFIYTFTSEFSFEGGGQAQSYIKDIKIIRSPFGPTAPIQDFPDGAIISIKFINQSQNVPGYLEIYDGSNDSKICSDTTDATFTSDRGSDKKLTIKYNTSTSAGDVITFVRMSGYWEILSIDTSFRITNRVWSTGASAESFIFDTNIHYLSSLGTNGNFISTPATINNNQASGGHPPNKFNFPTTGTSATNRQSSNLSGFAFRMSIDGNRNVMAQGNFKIFIRNINSAVFRINELNVWKVGGVRNYSYKPEFETVWTQAGGYMVDDKGFEIPISNVCFSINKEGIMFVSFVPGILPETGANMTFDVWVPPFSYQGNITVDPSSAPGGGGGDVVVVGF